MRIDRLLCELNIGSRSAVKELLKKGQVCVNGQVVKKADTKVDENTAVVTCQGKEFRYRPYVYYMLNKPAGVITATKDDTEKTVMDLFREAYLCSHVDLSGIPYKEMFPVGRLDKDTVGLLLLTNDGELSHNLLSPKKHVDKKYLVHLNGIISDEDADRLRAGVDIGEGDITAPSILERDVNDLSKCFLTITEGKFHQVKRMFQAVGLKVIYLKRVSMGSLVLDEMLSEGEIRELTMEEINSLKRG